MDRILPELKNVAPFHKMFLASTKDINNGQYSATGVLLHPFHNQMGLHTLWVWVANCRLASTLAVCLATVAA